jgi:hypothetical protein
LQLLVHRDDIGRFGSIDQRPNGCINQLVFVPVKVVVNQQIPHTVPGTVVQQQAAQNTGLGFNRMRRHAQLSHRVIAGKVGVEGVQGRSKNGGHG